MNRATGQPGKTAIGMVAAAWFVTSIYYFYQYVLRSAPSVMVPEMTEGFGLTSVGIASLLGLFYYAYAPFSLVAGVALDQFSPRKIVPLGAACIAAAMDESNQVAANGAGAALEHHLGMTCDPVAGFVQIPCIERCAFGAVKSWAGFLMAQNEIPANRRVDIDSVITALDLTAKEMNSKYKETSEGGMAVSLVLC